MSFEDRIRSAVDQVVGPLVKQILEEASADRDAAIHGAVEAADTRLRAALTEADAKAAEAMKAAVSEARVKEREIEMAAVSRLLESIRGLDGATSLSEVLDALALAAAREAARARDVPP